MTANFKDDARNILLKGKDLERVLNALDSAHRRHRNLEVEAKLKQPNNNTVLGRLLRKVTL